MRSRILDGGNKSSIRSRQVNAAINSWFWGGGGGTPIPSFVEPTPPASDLLIKFDFSKLSTMFQERSASPAGVPITAVTVQTDPVGTIYDLSRACKFAVANGATAIPTIGANGLLFDGSNDAITVAGTQAYLKQLHAVGATYAIRLKLVSGADASAKLIWGTQGLSGTHHGIVLNKTVGNKLQFFASGGTGQTIINYSSTKNFLVADGVVSVQINIASGANASSIRIGGTTETFTADLTKGSTTNCTNNLYLGGLTSFFGGQICESFEIVYGRVWTSQEMTDYDAQTTARTTADFDIVKQWQLDFSDSTKNFSDAAGTTPVTNNAITRLTRSGLTIPADVNSAINRNMTAADDTAAPVWLADADGNGHGGIRFDGDGVKLMTYGEQLAGELGGTYTLFFVLRNDDHTNGSHYMTESPQYSVITGNNYLDGPYTVIHQSLSIEPQIDMGVTGVNIICLRRRGTYMEVINRADQVDSTNTAGSISAINIGGSTQGADWLPDGRFFLVDMYRGFMPDAGTSGLTAKMEALRTQFTIPSNLA